MNQTFTIRRGYSLTPIRDKDGRPAEFASVTKAQGVAKQLANRDNQPFGVGLAGEPADILFVGQGVEYALGAQVDVTTDEFAGKADDPTAIGDWRAIDVSHAA